MPSDLKATAYSEESHGEVRASATKIERSKAADTRPAKTIGLCMIVKDEAHVILRCLDSVRPIVDYVLIEDTGSTDGTQMIIRDYLARENLNGEVFDEPWQDFAHNRSVALARLRQKHDIDYALIIDADDVLVLEYGFEPISFKGSLSHELYHVRIQHGAMWHSRPQICSNRWEFRYRGVLHEFIEGPAGWTSSTATGLHICISSEGARSQDPQKYHRDAALLEGALKTEEDPFLRSRYTFYLAQSYRDAGEKEHALEHYLKRAELGYWVDEVFMSLYRAGQVQRALGKSLSQVVATFLRASEVASHRAEALHAASRLCRENSKFVEGLEYARRGLRIAQPARGLFVESWIYDYGLLDEFAVNAYWCEHYTECLEACERLLRDVKFPERYLARISKNADFARGKLVSRVRAAPELTNIDEASQMNGKQRAPVKIVLICGPWGSGSSTIAEILDRVGAVGLPPYFMTNEPDAPNSYESIPFRETILQYVSEPTLSLIPCAPGDVQSGLRRLSRRIEQRDEAGSTKPIFLTYPASALVISQICEVFDPKVIYVRRPLEDIERTRLRRKWPPYFGAEGAAVIYDKLSGALKHHPSPTMNIDYAELLASPMERIRDMAQFIGLKPTRNELQKAVDVVRRACVSGQNANAARGKFATR